MNNITNLFSLQNKTVLITGASRGIGATLAKGLKEVGANVIIHGKNEKELKDILSTDNFDYYCADFKILKQVDEMLKALMSKYTTIDVIINNAGFEEFNEIEDITENNLNESLNVNFKSPFFIVQKLLPLLKKSKNASIINITSIHQEVPVRKNGSYCISKAALAMYTKIAALELANFNIRVNNIAPGAIYTDMNKEIVDSMDFNKWIPLGRVGKTEELIGPVIFLASNASSYMTGATLFIDGGYKENLLRY